MLPTQSVNFHSSTEGMNQSMSSQVPHSQPCEEFPMNICFSASHPKSELVRKGFCQLLLAGFRDNYARFGARLNLPELSDEPTITMYDDNTYSISWCPDFIYRVDKNEVLNHEMYAQLGPKQKRAHQRYIEGELELKKDLERKLEEFFNRNSQAPQQKEDPRVKELERKIRTLEDQVQEEKAQSLKEKDLKEQALKEKVLKNKKLKEQARQNQELIEQTLKENATLAKTYEKKLAVKDRQIQQNKDLLLEKDKIIRQYEELLRQLKKENEEEKRKNLTQQENLQKELTEVQRQEKNENSQVRINKPVEWKKISLLREMEALGSMEARLSYVQKHLSKDLKSCMEANSCNKYCDEVDRCGALLSTQRRNNNPFDVHLQCKLVYCRDHTDTFPDLSDLTKSLDTPLLDHWA